eukprot:gnl/TRDRNA2_/TRDRNA2_181386_c0_seq1.p1 gnl/TRDRNA2_/TRDRNA2_181386_c0~~gnl/TRDRNA2_/TRDRNA2_181386_c0_seq1.p1  ORF type:complete len:260 (+),score=86.30 gnl/TRDRNA2_/TRDRNA2_181386_c0_seq1:64-843(+)
MTVHAALAFSLALVATFAAADKGCTDFSSMHGECEPPSMPEAGMGLLQVRRSSSIQGDDACTAADAATKVFEDCKKKCDQADTDASGPACEDDACNAEMDKMEELKKKCSTEKLQLLQQSEEDDICAVAKAAAQLYKACEKKCDEAEEDADTPACGEEDCNAEMDKMEETRKKCLASGDDSLLQKQVKIESMDDVERSVKALLDRVDEMESRLADASLQDPRQGMEELGDVMAALQQLKGRHSALTESDAADADANNTA